MTASENPASPGETAKGSTQPCPEAKRERKQRYNARAMKSNLTLSRAQAGALARLIQTQVESYEEAACGAEEPRQRPPTRKAVEPFTGADLDLIEPLVALLEKLSGP